MPIVCGKYVWRDGWGVCTTWESVEGIFFSKEAVMGLPKVDRAKLRERLLTEFERTVDEVAEAVDAAPAGRVIRDSEEPARDALDRFRQVVYEEVLQAKVDASEAAFPPSDQRGQRQAETS